MFRLPVARNVLDERLLYSLGLGLSLKHGCHDGLSLNGGTNKVSGPQLGNVEESSPLIFLPAAVLSGVDVSICVATF